MQWQQNVWSVYPDVILYPAPAFWEGGRVLGELTKSDQTHLFDLLCVRGGQTPHWQ